MKPMLACSTPDNLNSLPYPLFVSPKLDGIRCIIKDGVALSRTLKPIRNKYIQAMLGNPTFNGLDGELIVGDPTAKDCMQVTNSGVMSIEGEPEFTYYTFDIWDRPGIRYITAYEELANRIQRRANWGGIVVLKQQIVSDANQLESYELCTLDKGYEGVIARRLDGTYKYGRSTAREGFLYKLKRFEQSEAVVIGYEPLLHNANEKIINELGYTQRSSAQGGKVELAMLGMLAVQGMFNGIPTTFGIGSGFTQSQREKLWATREELVGKIVTYKYFPIGSKDAPRHPIFLGFRDPIDMG